MRFAILCGAIALCRAAQPADATDTIGYAFDMVEAAQTGKALAMPSPLPFAETYAAALVRRDHYEAERKASRRPIFGLNDSEFDVMYGGRPSRWYVRTDGMTRVEYSAFGGRFTLLFDPHRHVLSNLDERNHTYRSYDTGDDSFFTQAPAAPGATPAPARTEVPMTVTFRDAGVRSLDGREVHEYEAHVVRGSGQFDQVDDVSEVPRPPIIPFAGIYQAVNIVTNALAQRGEKEPPNGLILFRAVRVRQTVLREMFKKVPDLTNTSDMTLVCRRGNVRPITAADAAVFNVPADYREAAPRAANPRFTFGRDSDDFVAFHECDDAPRAAP